MAKKTKEEWRLEIQNRSKNWNSFMPLIALIAGRSFDMLDQVQN